MATKRYLESTRPDDPRFPDFELPEVDENASDIDDCPSDHYSKSCHNSDSEQGDSDIDDTCAVPVRNVQLLNDESEKSNRKESRVKYFYGKNRLKWATQEKKRTIRVSASNKVTIKLPGVRGPVKNVQDSSSISDIWNCLFSQELSQEIISKTNQKLEANREKFQGTTRIEIRNVDEIEFQALLGLLLYSGVFKSGHEDLSSLFATDGTGRDLFRCTMSLKRILTLLACLRFDDSNTRQQRRKDNAAAPISWCFEKLVSNFQDNYILGEYVCVDEMLVGFRGRCSFKMYIPNKPNKYGIKVMILTDARNNYCYNAYIYSGRNSDGRGLDTNLLTLNKPTQAVLRLAHPIYGSNRNVTADNWFTSVELVNELTKRKLTYVGTMRKNKRDIPIAFLSNRRRTVGSTLYGFHGNMTLVSHVPKKSKVVIALSSMHQTSGIDQETRKPEIIALYNMTKGGVDSLDKKCANYSVNRRTRRWPMAVFYAMINMSSVNSYILYNCLPNRKQISRLDFIKQLAKELILPELKRRTYNDRLPSQLRITINRILGPDAPETLPLAAVENTVERSKRKRCYMCPKNVDRKTSYYCKDCKHPICLQCSDMLCRNCENRT
ncbi:piggyBac transposable element-derived protein 4-like [Onthophagus taurus]|uniref:piggyBac transposable element-derived protein 4-like n=1 Tax=Onthophagus taurus TaxID=166361 RepID=UPI0039BE1218